MRSTATTSSAIALGLGLAWLECSATAAPEPVSSYSSYEREALDDALRSLGRSLDPAPEEKSVEGIDVVRLPVIEPRDPAPDWLNLLHATSRDFVIQREVLLDLGAPYHQAQCDETARNLRALPELSLVLCVAERGADDAHTRVLVITKDVWSLRLAWNVTGTLGGIESLYLEPSETNLDGLHHTVFAHYLYLPRSYGLGAAYYIPRLEGTRIAASADATAYVNRDSGHVEAAAGRVAAGQPLYSLAATSAWQAQSSFYLGKQRVYYGTQVKRSHGIPIEYLRHELVDSAWRTWSFGGERKHDVTFGAELNVHQYRADRPAGASAAAFAAFVRDAMPVSETRVGPYVQYSTRSTEYARLWDLETLGLEENFRLGPECSVRLYPVTRALGSTHDLLGATSSAAWSGQLGDGFARLVVSGLAEADRDSILNGAFETTLRIATPRVSIGRLVMDVDVLDRFRNQLNRVSYLGGGGRLRGYPTNAFDGESYYVGNLEFRSRSLRVSAFELGGALFYDVGNAVDSFSSLAPRSSVGAGLRILFPQLDRSVFRIDLGVPLDRRPYPQGSAPFDPVTVFFTFDQAFPVPGTATTRSAAFGPGTGALGQ